MAQQSEKTERNTVTATTKKASPKKRATSKRKKTSKTASTSASRRKRVKRTGPSGSSTSTAPPSKSEAIDDSGEGSSITVITVASDAVAESGPAATGVTPQSGATDAPASSKSRTLKRSKPRAAAKVDADAESNGITRKRVTRKKKTAVREESTESPSDSKRAVAESSTEAATTSGPVSKSREPFGAGITRDRSSSPATQAPASESKPETPSLQEPVNKGSGEGVNVAADASENNEPKKVRSGRRRSRGGKNKRKKTGAATATAQARSTDSKSGKAPTDEPESAKDSEAANADVDDVPGETEEEKRARIVLKRRPVRRARRSKSRGKTGSSIDAKAEEKNQTTPQAKQPAATSAKTETETPDADAAPNEATNADDSPRKSTSTRTRRRRRGKGSSTGRGQSTQVTMQSTATTAVVPVDEETTESVELTDDISVITDDSPKETVQSEGREMIINSTAGAECRIAILHNGRLEEIYIERQSAASHVGNIYKGKITNVESSIQAAFVDFGLAKNGFLHISDVLPKYFPNKADATEDVGKKVPRRDRPPIQKCFRRGDEVIVQVAKEGVGTKGPTLTTYLSIPGRFVVMMPGMSKLGVSRRIEDDADRKAMRDLLGELSMPDGMGFILRTAGLNRNKRELQSDLNYLNRLWKTVQKRIKNQATPCELYQESDLVIRTIRDVYSSDFKRIVVDDHAVAVKAKDFLRIAMPRTQGDVVAFQKHEPIFHFYGIEQEIQRIYSRHVPLPSGGSIVIDSTEAMVAIDVNSGKYRDQNDAEETAYRINIEAAGEIARQLRLRDLGGLVVCDFIDMRQDRHKRAVEKALRDALKLHKERARILRMSKFGLIEMTRQRQGPSIKRSVFVDCRHCSGSGLVKTAESMSLEVLRILQLLTHRNDVAQVAVSVAPDVCTLVLNQQRSFLNHLETKSNKKISILPDPTFTNDEVSYKCIDDRGMPLRIEV